jgi:molybdate transport system substrate-binding protein
MQPVYTPADFPEMGGNSMKLQTIRVIFVVTAIVASNIALGFPFAREGSAQTSSLRVYTSDGFKSALQALTPQIEHSLGRKVSPEFDSSKVLQQKIESGDAFDVAILSTTAIDALIKGGKVAADTRTGLGRAGIGVGVRAGAPKPDVSTPEAMKHTLLSAKSITFNPEGASSVHVNEMVQQMGIVDKVKPKFMLTTVAGQPQRDVVAGKAEMVITLIPEITDFKGLDLAGPLPGDLQSYVNFAVAVSANPSDPAAAKALIKFLVSPATAPELKANGIEAK